MKNLTDNEKNTVTGGYIFSNPCLETAVLKNKNEWMACMDKEMASTKKSINIILGAGVVIIAICMIYPFNKLEYIDGIQELQDAFNIMQIQLEALHQNIALNLHARRVRTPLKTPHV